MFEKIANKLKKAVDEQNEIAFRNFDEATKEAEEQPAPVEETPVATEVAPAKKDANANLELKLVRPESFSQAGDVADFLLQGYTVILNTECLDDVQLRRMCDFLNGVVFANDGSIKNVAKSTFIITPNGVDISDDVR